MKVIIFGATGMVGQGVLLECLEDPRIERVLVIGRRRVPREHPKLAQIVHRDFTDFSAVAEQLAGYQACFFCLGVSSLGMSEEKYRHITYDFTLAAAHTLVERNEQMSFCYVTGAGADSTEKGRSMWARVKGKTENDLLALPFRGAYMFRPGYIQPVKGVVSGVWWTRLIYALMAPAFPLWNAVLPRQVTTSERIGRAMIRLGERGGENEILNPVEINRLAADDFVDHAPRRIETVKGRAWVSRVLLAAFSVFLLFVSVLVIDGWQAFGRRAEGERAQRMEASPQWDDETFGNPQPIRNDNWRAFSEMFEMSSHGSPTEPLPVIQVDPGMFDDPPATGLRVTWFGHSSMLIEIDGKRVLTDPVWGERAAPWTWIGPQRWYPPPLALDDLPELDAVVISHDHYDHLDYPTISAMQSWDTVFIVPLGVAAHLEYWGVPVDRIVELDWWERHEIAGLEIVSAPARHASGRVLLDYKTTLWAGYALLGDHHRVFFTGDTGLFPGLTEIGERLGPFDLTMIEAAAYGQAWPDWHIGPEQAVRAHKMLRGKVYMPVHWGLFNLAYHGWTEPLERTMVATEAAGVDVYIPKPGASFEPENLPKVERWWPLLPWRTAAEYPIVSSQVD